ncbi:MAG: hypothetical protein ABJG78_07260 [Cyclobacteriaceae bacterium]
MPNYPTNHHLYTLLWNKYRPAIVKLMADAQEAPQEYKFQPHEFKDVNPKEKGGYWFTMEVYKGKAQNNIKGSVVAQDLLLILQKSGRALEMFETAKYEFTLDKQFTFGVSQEPVVEETEEEENAAEAEESSKETVEEVAAEEATEEVKEEEVKEEAEAEKKEG